MKTIKFTLLLVIAMVLTLVLMVPAAFAVGNGQAAADVAVAADQSAVQQSSANSGVVPQAQVDRVKKREEMNKRRAELLKLRQQLIETDNPGNLDGQLPVQPIQ